MDTKTRIIFNSLLGFSLGLMIGAVMMAFFATYEELNDRIALLVQLFGSGLLGAVNMGTTIVYDLEEWGIVKATFTHYLVAFFSFLTASEVLGWFSHNILLIVCILFTIAYVIIWLIQFLIWKRKVRELNKDLEIMLSKESKL